MKTLIKISTIILLILSMNACLYFPACISGSGPVITREFDLRNFDEISSETVIDIEVVQGDQYKVVAEGHENIMSFLDLKVVNNRLYIDLTHGSFSHFEMKIFITVPTLKEIEVESTGNIRIDGFSNLESLRVKSNSTGNIIGDGEFVIDGDLEIISHSTGNIRLEAICHDIDVRSSSTGNVSIEGSCSYQNVSLSRTGNYNAFDLYSEECEVDINGTGDARVFADKQLDVTIRSVGNVYYKGRPDVNINDYSVGDLIFVN